MNIIYQPIFKNCNFTNNFAEIAGVGRVFGIEALYENC